MSDTKLSRKIKVWAVVGLSAALTLGGALASAQASTTSWYWSEARAERAIDTYEGIDGDAECDGYGRRYHKLTAGSRA